MSVIWTSAPHRPNKSSLITTRWAEAGEDEAQPKRGTLLDVLDK